MRFIDYYQVMGLADTVSADEIKRCRQLLEADISLKGRSYVLHAGGARFQILAERPPGDRLDDQSGPLQADAVLPARTWIGDQRLVERLALAGRHPRQVHVDRVAEDIGVPGARG